MPDNSRCCGGCGCGDNCCWIILILLIVFCCCGNKGFGCGC